MNKFLNFAIIAFTLVTFLTGCNKEDDFVPSAKVDPQTLQFLYTGGTSSFKITSNVDWIIEKETDADWITLSETSGNSDAVIEVSVTENTVITSRSASITVKAKDLPDITVTVQQSSSEPSINVDKQSLQFSSDNDTLSIAITSNTFWTIEKDADWITLSKTSGSFDTIVTVSVIENTAITPRSASITVKVAGLNDITVTVQQSAAEPSIEVDKQSLQFSSDGGIDGFIISSNTSWVIETDADWITLSETSGRFDTIITVSITENTDITSRSASITIKAEGLSDIKITVNQSKALETVGLYILSEGYLGYNASDIAYYDVKTEQLTKKYFSQQNGKALGDGANDLALYGSKLYCVVSGSSTYPDGYIEVINPETGVSIKRIPVTNEDGTNASPRNIIFHENKAYITTYSQTVVRLDTASLTIDNEKANLSGTYAEGICLHNGNFYICNSGWGDGNTISVVNLASFTETETITVPPNPVAIKTAASGEIYFTTADLSWKGGSLSNLYILNPEQKQVAYTFDIRASKIALTEDFIYTVDSYSEDYLDYTDYIHKINLQTKEVTDISDIYEDYMVYNVSTNPLNGDIYIGNQGQNFVAFDKDGNEKFSLKTSVAITSTVVPIFK
jgi:hypothetical protein